MRRDNALNTNTPLSDLCAETPHATSQDTLIDDATLTIRSVCSRGTMFLKLASLSKRKRRLMANSALFRDMRLRYTLSEKIRSVTNRDYRRDNSIYALRKFRHANPTCKGIIETRSETTFASLLRVAHSRREILKRRTHVVSETTSKENPRKQAASPSLVSIQTDAVPRLISRRIVYLSSIIVTIARDGTVD